jgi:ABC-type transport system substrate-binding protein
VVTPWKTPTPLTTPTWVLERNPDSVWVDTDGNQLPYIDRILITLGENLEVINLRAIAGEYDSPARHIDISKLPVLLGNQQKGGYRVYLDPSDQGADVGLLCNQTYEKNPEIAKWFAHREFRIALSHGIDRSQINETFVLGLAQTGSAAPGERTLYFPGPEYRRSTWATTSRATSRPSGAPTTCSGTRRSSFPRKGRALSDHSTARGIRARAPRERLHRPGCAS